MDKGKRNILGTLLAFEIAAASFIAGRITGEAPSSVANRDTKDKVEIYTVAEKYLETGNYSREGLIKAMTDYEYFDEESARSVIEAMDIDWQEEAVDEVDAYLNMTGNSEKQIRDYLKRDLYTDEEIEIALKKADPDWHEQAERCSDYLRKSGASESEINSILLNRGFSPDEI